MPRYKIIDEGEGFYTVKGVPIFEMHTDRGFPCDQAWMEAAIHNHEAYKGRGYRPTIIVGHNVKGKEKEAVGFLDNLVLKGKRLYADFVRVGKDMKEKVVRNSFPSRSVEVLPKSKRILTLALLGGTTPHFSLPQMAYENEENGEYSLFFRSPEMDKTITDEEKQELFSQIRSEVIPGVLTELFAANDGEEAVEFVDEDTGETFAIPATALALLRKLGTGAGKGAVKAGARVAAAKGMSKAGVKVGGAAIRAGGAAMRHPAVAGAGIAGAAAGAGGAAAARRKKKYNMEGYAIDEETGTLYVDGTPVGLVVTYEEMQEAGMQVPTAVKKPQALPGIAAVDPQLAISAADVGIDSGDEAGARQAPPPITGDIVQPLDRADSEQFEEGVAVELYNLKQEVGQLHTANALLSEGRKAEEYTKYLESQRTAGAPVGDIERTVDFLMTQTPEQVEEFKELLTKQPKVAFEKAEQIQTFALGDEAEIKADYAANKDTFQAMGVSDKDLKYAKFVRINRAVGERVA